MRRRRLLTKRGGRSRALVTRSATSDLTYLQHVVTVRFPVQSARTYLQRAIGNPVKVHLVEVRRGERPGIVREVAVEHANSGDRTTVRAERVLATGEPASFFVPDHLVQVRPVVSGHAAQTGMLSRDDVVVLVVPVRGYLRFLPGVFGGDGPVASRNTVRSASTALQRAGGRPLDELSTDVDVDGDPIRRFLFMFQHLQTQVTDEIDDLVKLTDPILTDAKFLGWLASWVGFELDASLPIHQQRELVRRAIRLYRTRGTRIGIEEMVGVLTSAPVRVKELTRPPAMVLGRTAVIGGSDVGERYQRNEPTGGYLLEASEWNVTSFFELLLEARDAFRERFGERAVHVLERIVKVVSRERPAHVYFTIRFDDSV